MKIHYELIGSDHLPLSMTLEVGCNIESVPVHNEEAVEKYNDYVDWNNLNDDEIKAIDILSLDMMCNFFDRRVTQCSKIVCREADHIYL